MRSPLIKSVLVDKNYDIDASYCQLRIRDRHYVGVGHPITSYNNGPIIVAIVALSIMAVHHSAGKHDRGPLFFTLFSFILIRSRSTGSI